jgi:WD40 repeat protein
MLIALSLVVLAGASAAPPVAPAPQQIYEWVASHTFTSTNPVTTVAFGPDIVVTGDQKGVLVLWHAQTGKKLETILDGTGDKKPINRVQFSPDGTWLYLVTNNGEGTHQCLVEKPNRVFHGLIESNNVKKVHGVSNDGAYWLWSGIKAKLLLQVKGLDDDVLMLVPGGKFEYKDVISMAAADGDVIVGAADEAIVCWENSKNGPRWEKSLERFGPTALALSFGGKVVALAGKNGEVRLFAASTGNLDITLTGHKGAVTAVAFSPDGKQLVTGGADATVRIWSVATGRELATLKGHTAAVTAVAFSPGGEMLVSGSEDKTARVWKRK